MPEPRDDVDASLAMHDELIARRGVEIWIGAEPTFTRTDSVEPAWTTAACGGDLWSWRPRAGRTAAAPITPCRST